MGFQPGFDPEQKIVLRLFNDLQLLKAPDGALQLVETTFILSLSAQKAMYRENQIRRHFPEAWIDGYEDLIPAMTNHPKDRHVLAAAARAGAKIIVTYNIKDFPRSALMPYSITAYGPSSFLKDLYAAAPAMVMQTLEDQAAAIGKSMAYLLSRLQINVPPFVEMIGKKL